MISVIIPTYNREKVIERAVHSVLNQANCDSLEVIVVDDCSNDATEEVIKNISDSRVKFARLEKNSGACVARNKGIELACGEYIAFQDSDDEWLPNKLEIQLREMKENNAMVSFCSFYKINENLGTKAVFPQNVSNGFIDYKRLLKKSIVSTQCIVAKRECFDSVKFDPQMPRLQDWDIILSLAQKYEVFHVDQPLVNKYVQEESISAHPEKGIVALTLLQKKHAGALAEDSETRRSWHIYLGNYILANGGDPSNEYKKALAIRFDRGLFVKYLLAKMHIIGYLYKKTGRL